MEDDMLRISTIPQLKKYEQIYSTEENTKLYGCKKCFKPCKSKGCYKALWEGDPEFIIKHEHCEHYSEMHFDCMAFELIDGDLSFKCQHQVQYDEKFYPCNLDFSKTNLYDLSKYVDIDYLVKEVEKNRRDTLKRIEYMSMRKILNENGFFPHKLNEEDIMYYEKLSELNIYPCPICKEQLYRISGCYRINCPSCHTSFWLPTGESWEKVSEKMKGSESHWYDNPVPSSWVKYWRKWL
jgi:transposase-like protein